MHAVDSRTRRARARLHRRPARSADSRRRGRQARGCVVIAIVGVFFVLELGGALLRRERGPPGRRAPPPDGRPGARREPVRDAPGGATADAALHVRPAARRAGGRDLQRGCSSWRRRCSSWSRRSRRSARSLGAAAGIMLAVAMMALLVNGLSAWLLHDVIGHPTRTPMTRTIPRTPPRRTSTTSTRTTRARARARARTHAHAHGRTHPRPGTHGGHGHALNLRGAWLHLLGDALGARGGARGGAGHPLRRGPPRPTRSRASWSPRSCSSARCACCATPALVLLEAAPPHLPVAAIREVVVRESQASWPCTISTSGRSAPGTTPSPST